MKPAYPRVLSAHHCADCGHAESNHVWARDRCRVIWQSGRCGCQSFRPPALAALDHDALLFEVERAMRAAHGEDKAFEVVRELRLRLNGAERTAQPAGDWRIPHY